MSLTFAQVIPACQTVVVRGLCTLLLLALPAPSSALVFNVTFNDPGNAFSGFYSPIRSHIVAAGSAWDTYIGGDGNLEVVVGFSGIPTATGRSVTSGFVRSRGSVNVFEQGAVAEIRTGVDPNGLL